jgi:hypothetical protein
MRCHLTRQQANLQIDATDGNPIAPKSSGSSPATLSIRLSWALQSTTKYQFLATTATPEPWLHGCKANWKMV